MRGQEFASFLSDLSDVVAQHIDTWRVRVVEAITYWHQLGFGTTLLERTLEQADEPDVDALLQQYEAAIARLRELQSGGGALRSARSPRRTSSAIRSASARRSCSIARQLGGAEPPPAPDPAFTRA